MILVSHRGYHWPNNKLSRPLENTKSSVEKAWDLGMVLVEVDVRVTKDGCVILFHDEYFNGKLCKPSILSKTKINKNTLEHIQQNIEFHNGDSITTLESLLPLLNNFRQLIIEIKHEENSEQSVEFVTECILKIIENYKEYIPCVISFNKKILRLMSSKFKTLWLTSHNFEENIVTEPFDVCEHTIELEFNGLYLEFQLRMLWNVQTIENLTEMCKKGTVGIYGCPEESEIYEILVNIGVEFINTDMI